MKYYIGIDLGGTNVRTLLVDENGKSYSEVKDATEREKGPDYVCSKIMRQIESLDCSICGGWKMSRELELVYQALLIQNMVL